MKGALMRLVGEGSCLVSLEGIYFGVGTREDVPLPIAVSPNKVVCHSPSEIND